MNRAWAQRRGRQRVRMLLRSLYPDGERRRATLAIWKTVRGKTPPPF